MKKLTQRQRRERDYRIMLHGVLTGLGAAALIVGTLMFK